MSHVRCTTEALGLLQAKQASSPSATGAGSYHFGSLSPIPGPFTLSLSKGSGKPVLLEPARRLLN